MIWKVGCEKYRTNYASVNICSFVTLSLHYPFFVLLLLCLYLILSCIILSSVLLFCLCITLFLFFCYFVFMLILSYIILYSVLLLLCLYNIIQLFCSPVTLSFHYPVSIKKDKNLLKGSIKQTIICIFAC